MAGVSKETEVAAAAVRGNAADKQIVMGNQSDIHPEASSKCACSSSSSGSLESQGGRSGPRRRYPCQIRPRDCPLVYQPPARTLRLPMHPPPSPPPRLRSMTEYSVEELFDIALVKSSSVLLFSSRAHESKGYFDIICIQSGADEIII
ncbi:hypothetical protein L3X38_004717 [Prunus dulcis]|uniref:Uncharacterized protein n=1 Tax=Prunus dulcis TaxID=3755 RepID=A0AAD5F3C9_PRUDU|nr:hypothetical protein L3X38_004717 [Prunus dulcis]